MKLMLQRFVTILTLYFIWPLFAAALTGSATVVIVRGFAWLAGCQLENDSHNGCVIAGCVVGVLALVVAEAISESLETKNLFVPSGRVEKL